MKNIFKFLSIALVAGAMMVACNPDNENGNTDTTPVNPQPQPQPATPSASATFAGAEYNFPVQTGMYSATYGLTAFDFFTSGGSITEGMPGCEIYTLLTAAGQGTATLNTSGSLPQLEGDPAVLEFYMNTYLTNQSGTAYGDWWGETAEINMTTFDMDNGKASFTVNATMFDALNSFVAEGNPDYVGFDAAERAQMTVTATNVPFTAQK